MERGRDIIPSSLGIRETPQFDDGGVFSNWILRFGEVQEILYVDNDRNRSKKYNEYNVFVQHRDGATGAGVMYTNCMLQNTFGGFADECHYTLRIPKTPSTQDKNSNGLGLGAKVLILCLNGERSNAYIIGGMREAQLDDRDKKAKDLGHHFFWTFNGIRVFVNKDGELELLYTGKTNIDGKVNDDVDSNAPNAKIQFLKNGNINIGTRENKQQVLLDNENGKISIQRDKALEIGEHTDKMLLGESFRNEHKQMHDEMKQQFNLMKDILQQAGTQITAAGAATLAPGAPIPGLQAAGALLITASQIAGQLAQAIDNFEVAGQEKNSYLSKKNSSD